MVKPDSLSRRFDFAMSGSPCFLQLAIPRRLTAVLQVVGLQAAFLILESSAAGSPVSRSHDLPLPTELEPLVGPWATVSLACVSAGSCWPCRALPSHSRTVGFQLVSVVGFSSHDGGSCRVG